MENNSIVKLPNELIDMIAEQINGSDMSNFRLTCKKLAECGLKVFLKGTNRVHLYIGVCKEDLTVLNALLANKDIVEKVDSVSFGCACVQKYKHGFRRPDDDDWFSDGQPWRTRSPQDDESVISMMTIALEQLGEWTRKGTTVQFGSTFHFDKWETLPFGLQKMRPSEDEWSTFYASGGVEPDLATFKAGCMKTIYDDQARQQDWAVYILIKSILRSDGDPFRIDFLFKGIDVASEMQRCSEQEDCYEDNLGKIPFHQVWEKAAQSKSAVFKKQLGSLNQEMRRKLGLYVGRIDWLDLPDAYILDASTGSELNSLWYSQILQILYGLPYVDYPVYRTVYQDLSQSLVDRNRIRGLPVSTVTRLELADFILKELSPVETMCRRSGSLFTLSMKRGFLQEGSWRSVFEILVQKGLDNLHLEDLYGEIDGEDPVEDPSNLSFQVTLPDVISVLQHLGLLVASFRLLEPSDRPSDPYRDMSKVILSESSLSSEALDSQV